MKKVIVIVLSILLFQSLGCTYFIGRKTFDKASTQQVEKLISENIGFRELHKICEEIPKPEDFILLGTNPLFNPKGIQYFYDSKTDYYLAEKFFRSYFKKKKWDRSDAKSIRQGDVFSDGNVEITIYYGSIDAKYSVSCFEVE